MEISKVSRGLHASMQCDGCMPACNPSIGKGNMHPYSEMCGEETCFTVTASLVI